MSKTITRNPSPHTANQPATPTATESGTQPATTASRPRQNSGNSLLNKLSQAKDSTAKGATSFAKGTVRVGKTVAKGVTSVAVSPFYTRNKANAQKPNGSFANPDKIKLSHKPMGEKTMAKIDNHMQEISARHLAPGSHSASSSTSQAPTARNSVRVFNQTTAGFFQGSDRLKVAGLQAALISTLAQPDKPEHLARAFIASLSLSLVSGENADKAHAALNFLKHEFSPLDHHANSDTAKAAFATAVHLSMTPSGQDTLVSLMKDRDPQLAENSKTGSTKREALFTLLQTANHISFHAPSAGIALDTPGAFKQYTDTILSRPANSPETQKNQHPAQAMACAAKVYANPAITAKEIGKPAEVSAYVAWRNDYHEAGKDSAFAKSKKRMAKTPIWMARAVARARNPLKVLDPRRIISHQKSPFSGMEKGLGGTHLDFLNKEIRNMAGKMQSAMGKINNHINTLVAQPDIAPQTKQAMLLKQAVLNHWDKKLSTPDNIHNEFKLTKQDRADIATQALELIQQHDLGAGLTAKSLLKGNDLKNLGRLSLSTLEDITNSTVTFRQELSTGVTNGRQTGLSGTTTSNPLLNDIHQDLADAKAIKKGRQSNIKIQCINDIRENMLKLVDSPFAQKYKMTDGGELAVGFGLSLNLGSFSDNPKVPTISVGPTSSYGLRRQGVVEVGHTSSGSVLFMGTEKRQTFSTGLSAFAGWVVAKPDDASKHPHKDHNVLIGLSKGAAYNHSRTNPVGIAIRSHRPYNVGADGKVTKLDDVCRSNEAEVINFMSDQAIEQMQNHAPTDPDTLWDHYAEKFFQHEDLSVSWREGHASTHSASVNLSLGARVALAETTEGNKVRFGPVLGAGYENTFSKGYDRRDQSGSVHNEESMKGWEHRFTVSASLVASAIPALGKFSKKSGHVASMSAPSGPNLGAWASVGPMGVNSSFRTVLHKGRIDPVYTAREVEFDSKNEFIAYINKVRPELAKTPEANAELDKWMKQVLASPDSNNQGFGETRLLKRDIAQSLDHDGSVIDSLNTTHILGKPVEVSKPMVEQMVKIESDTRENAATKAKDSQNWESQGFYTYELPTESYSAGLNFMINATATTGSTGIRTLDAIGKSKLEEAGKTASSQGTPADSPTALPRQSSDSIASPLTNASHSNSMTRSETHTSANPHSGEIQPG